MFNIKDIKWAANYLKLERAFKVYPENEEKCKELYISLGGAILKQLEEKIPETTEIQPKQPIITPPEAPQAPIQQEEKKVDATQPVSPFRCPQCEFIGKGERSLATHFRLRHK